MAEEIFEKAAQHLFDRIMEQVDRGGAQYAPCLRDDMWDKRHYLMSEFAWFAQEVRRGNLAR